LWYWRFFHRVEHERGLNAVEDLYLPGLWRSDLKPGESMTIIATTEEIATVDLEIDRALQRERARQTELSKNAPDEFTKRLYLAADQFIVRRQVDDQWLNTIIAGYHWFGDWGRDTMIALEGLTLTTGRFVDAKNILRAFGRFVDQGMLPNRFPDVGVEAAPIEYNTVDATLWYFHALARYLVVTQDEPLLRELFPILESIIDWHLKGTRYNIRVDPTDGLVWAGQMGVQLTWMDAKVGDWVVTPRIGKPVEINALWYSALKSMDTWSATVGRYSTRYADLLTRVRISFDRFWYAEGKYLYDVIDAPSGNDASLRPNQLFALSLADDLIPLERAQSILDIVTRQLLTPLGLRSLSPRDPNYRALYRGDQHARDAAYHQGIVWGWLIGVYVDAHLHIYNDRSAARALLEPFRAHLSEAGLGSISEIFEAEPPFRPVGCIAQAWSVAEVLRILKRVNE
jgi:predicted glycogen debranching enzyme